MGFDEWVSVVRQFSEFYHVQTMNGAQLLFEPGPIGMMEAEFGQLASKVWHVRCGVGALMTPLYESWE